MSNSLTCGSRSAALPWSGPRRAMRESFQTPTSRLPWSRTQMPPNIFFSSTPFFRARASRIRAARASLNGIAPHPRSRFSEIVIALQETPTDLSRHAQLRHVGDPGGDGDEGAEQRPLLVVRHGVAAQVLFAVGQPRRRDAAPECDLALRVQVPHE